MFSRISGVNPVLRIRNDLFRIQLRIQPLLVPVLFKYIQSKRRIYQLVAIFYFVLQSYSTHSPEFTGDRLKMRYEIVTYHFLFRTTVLQYT